MKTKTRIILWTIAGVLSLAAAVAIARFSSRQNPVEDRPLTHAALMEKLRGMVDESVRSALTNDVVGLNRTISIQCYDYQDTLSNWQAIATVERINQLGGIERLRLHYSFASGAYDGNWFLIALKDCPEYEVRAH